MKVTKSVTLDEETARKAKEMDNFSLYIRECLTGKMHINHEQLKRQVKYFAETIKIARDLGSQSKQFKDRLTGMIL